MTIAATIIPGIFILRGQTSSPAGIRGSHEKVAIETGSAI
jgi:hypothetical protein